MLEVRLSQHAIERFRERMFDASEGTIEAYVLTPRVRAALGMGATRVSNVNGMHVFADGAGTVTTIYPDTWHPRSKPGQAVPRKRRRRRMMEFDDV